MNTVIGKTVDNPRAIPGWRRLSIAFTLGALAAFAPLSTDMYLPALPSLARDLHATTSFTQLSLTACLLGLALGQVLIGTQSDARGRRVPLVAALVGFIVSSFFCARSSSMMVFVMLRFIEGLGGAAGMVISRAVARDLYSGHELIRFYALLMLVNGAGPVLAPVAGAQLIHVTSWRGIFVTLGLVGLFMLVVVLLLLPETLPVHRRSRAGVMDTARTFRVLLRDRAFIGYALPQGMVGGALFAYISGSSFVIQNIFGASPQMFSVYFAINAVGLVAAAQITGRLAGRVKGTRLFAAGLGLASAGGVGLLVAVLAGGGLPVVLVCLFAVVSSVGLVSTSGFPLSIENYGHAAGSASALSGLLSLTSGAVAAPLVGLGGGYTAVPMGIACAVAGTGAVVVHAVLRPRGGKTV